MFSVFCSGAFAQSKTTTVEISKSNVQVYKKPSFDADVIVALKKGQKLYALKKKIVGEDGFGLFYKVRLKKGVHGYILDTSVRGFKAKTRSVKKKQKKSGGISGGATKEDNKVEEKSPSSYKAYSPLYAKSYGLLVSSLNYSVNTKSGTRKSNEMFFGGKISGQGWGAPLPLEVSLLFSPSSPSLFDSFTEKHSGFVAISEVGLPFEIKKGSNWSIFLSLSGVLSYYNFSYVLGGQDVSGSKLEFGASAGLGGRIRFGRYILGVEGKYIKLGASHTGAHISLSRIF
ncbi:MAG: SH3 domain-containing protein [Bdellovibrionales bacterium]